MDCRDGLAFESSPLIPKHADDIYMSVAGYVGVFVHYSKGPLWNKDAASTKRQFLKVVTPDFIHYITHPVLWKTFFEAAVWHFVLSEVFEAESELWAGPVGKDFDRLCKRI
jgi:hypothetical protein